MAAIGDVDETNCAVGLVIASLGRVPLTQELSLIQNELFDLGADLATPQGGDFEAHALRITTQQVERLERAIDDMNLSLDPLTSFILPSGSTAVSALHLARAVARRAERSAVGLKDGGADLNPAALAYLNRLSDYLFVAARFVAAGEGGDVLWRPGATREGPDRPSGG
jgi:cob(I)alamin adenosyltransferase